MGASCCDGPPPDVDIQHDDRYRRVLWAVLAINGVMFVAEITAGLLAGSVSLQADALDFLGDTANYGISLFVVGMALRYRAMAALMKGASMGVFGLWVAGATVLNLLGGTVPQAETMGIVGALAFVANLTCFGLLYAYRNGDANMRSVWICSRNDALGNVAVLLAAVGVFGTAQGWPDAVVAGIMAILALQGAWVTIRAAMKELKSPEALASGA
ncbi:MAG: cation transporter [Rhodospirillaceae bacterium]|nr:cation transporter [Rhodospirillaceae bacterium]